MRSHYIVFLPGMPGMQINHNPHKSTALNGMLLRLEMSALNVFLTLKLHFVCLGSRQNFTQHPCPSL